MSNRIAATMLGRPLGTLLRAASTSAAASSAATSPAAPISQRANLRPQIPNLLQFARRRIHTESHFPRQGGRNGSSRRKSFAGSGLLLVAVGADSSAVPSAIAAAEPALLASTKRQADVLGISRQIWQRNFLTERPGGVVGRRWVHHNTPENAAKKAHDTASPKPSAQTPPETGPAKPGEHDPESIASSVSKYFHLPNLPHRPTKQELLAAANGFWERLRVRFKWVSIRSMRPWNIDEWGAFVSWFLFGHLVWILVGTTTFFSLLIYSINTVFAQETLARWVGDYLTQSAGLTVVFESAIVPKWKDGVISFRNVFVSRRPGQIKSSVSKGSSTDAAAAVAAAGRQPEPVVEVDDGNYTQFDITIATVNVTLSFLKWWNGKGLLKDVEVKGVRGVVDRTSVVWSSAGIDPFSYRHIHHPGDFEIDAFRLEDLLVTVHQPGGFRPFSVSIYSCELPQLRKQWLFYDFLSANHMSGSFDGSLFTIHPRQVHGSVGDKRSGDDLGEPDAWKKFSRLRIDGLKIDHLNRGVDGPFGWIYEGNVDIVADVMFPRDEDEGIGKVMSDFYDQLEEIVIANRQRFLSDAPKEDFTLLPTGHISAAGVESMSPVEEAEPAVQPSETSPAEASTADEVAQAEDDRRFLVMDLRIHLNDVRAAVPLFTRDISYINQALVRPIVAYINAKKTYIPIGCRIVKRASDFDGSWTVFDCGLMNDLSAETYEAFARDVEDQQNRMRRLKKVGFWTLSLAVHALFMGMAGDVI